MTILNPTSNELTPPRPAWLSGCITIFAILFAIVGIWNLVFGLLIAYIFFSARMLSTANIVLLLIIAGDCLIYFILAFRLKRQYWLLSLILLAVVWLVLPLPTRFLINIATARLRIDGYAMEPTLPNASYVIANRQAYQWHPPQRGDVVVFTKPLNPPQDLIKRVIGLPGEKVTVREGQVMIDGVPLDEPYITEPPLYEGEWVVSEGHFFVLGDKRNDSRDSHQWGTLPQENIFAKVVWIYWPLSHFGKIDFSFAP